MGQPPLNQFTVRISLDKDNRPNGLIYYDQEGCGHESLTVFGLNSQMQQLIGYHDDHRVNSHRQEPRKTRCSHEAISGEPTTRCQLNQGHELETSKGELGFKHKVEMTW